MVCSASGVKTITRKLSVNFWFRESNLFYVSSDLKWTSLSSECTTDWQNHISYIFLLSYFLSPQNGNVGDTEQSLINLSTCLSTANLKFFKVSLPLNNAALAPSRPSSMQTLTGVSFSAVCQRKIIQCKWSNLVFCHVLPGVPWTLSFLAD